MSLAFIFPGQGSQSVGMLSELAKEFPLVKRCYAEASEILGFNLWDLCLNGPTETLNQTINTQPALLAAGVAIWRIWQENNGTPPNLMAGHSLGEYTALVCAQAITFKDAVTLVAERGKVMQEAVPDGAGAMAAVLSLTDEKVVGICAQFSGNKKVSVANFNSPGQVVIAGHKSAVEQAIILAKESGAKRAILLPVSVPSHCQLMEDAALQFSTLLDKVPFAETNIPVIHNVDVVEHTKVAEVKEVLVRQLYQPVRWTETILTMQARRDITKIIESGPGKILTGLTKRIDRNIDCFPIFDPDSLHAAMVD